MKTSCILLELFVEGQFLSGLELGAQRPHVCLVVGGQLKYSDSTHQTEHFPSRTHGSRPREKLTKIKGYSKLPKKHKFTIFAQNFLSAPMIMVVFVLGIKISVKES